MFPLPRIALFSRMFNFVRYAGLYLGAVALTLWGPTLVLADGMVPDTSVVIVNEADGEASVSVEDDGNELARRLRNQPETKHALLVALTGYGQAADRQRSQEAGFDHHLVKPADFDEVEKILAAVG